MPVTIPQLKELLQQPTHKKAIKAAVVHEDRVRLHTEVTITKSTNHAITEYLKWVDNLLPEYKAYLFKLLFRFPVKSVSLTTQMFQALEKLFDGRDLTRIVSFTDPAKEEDQADYFKRIKFQEKWRKKSFNAFKRKFNSIMVCDLPSEQQGRFPDPYYYMLSISNVIAFDWVPNKEGEEIDWILFHSGKDRMSYFDTKAFETIKLKDGEPVGIEDLIPHDLGRCPARFFMSDELNDEDPTLKVSAMSCELSKLDWFLFHEVSKNHLDLYASFPIYWGVEEDCDYTDVTNDLKCDGGFLHSESDGTYAIDRNAGSLMSCPKCSNSRLNGAGSYNVVPAPETKEDAVVLPPVGIVTTDVGSLRYNVEEHQRLRLELYTNVTGFSGDLKTDQAVNEKQVAASYDSRAAVLKKWKQQFEKAEEWLVLTLCELKYGPGSVANLVIDYGTEFYLSSPNELLSQYRDGIGRDSQIVLSSIQDQYYETKHRNNSTHMLRIRILQALEPLRHVDVATAKLHYDEGLIDYSEYYLKISFASLIDRFERENTDVITFGSALDFPQKIDAIRKTLMSYVTKPKQQPNTGGQD